MPGRTKETNAKVLREANKLSTWRRYHRRHINQAVCFLRRRHPDIAEKLGVK